MRTHLFLLGGDYHLGDLLWLTPVLAEYRREFGPLSLIVGCPDRPISRILEGSPVVDELLYGDAGRLLQQSRRRFGDALVVRDLRPFSLAAAMLREWRRRAPWLYFYDLWWRARGEWLCNFLRLHRPDDLRPRLSLNDGDRTTAAALPSPYVLLAPRTGSYPAPLSWFWHAVKGRPEQHWQRLAAWLRRDGYEPVTLAAADQPPVAGTIPLLGLPIRQVAGVIEQAAALVTVESGLWFIAAACQTPFVINPWWLPRSVDWAAPMNVPYRLIYRSDSSPERVYASVRELIRVSRD
jgi:ADP-heptose:LPS heptosyltransferase